MHYDIRSYILAVLALVGILLLYYQQMRQRWSRTDHCIWHIIALDKRRFLAFETLHVEQKQRSPSTNRCRSLIRLWRTGLKLCPQRLKLPLISTPVPWRRQSPTKFTCGLAMPQHSTVGNLPVYSTNPPKSCCLFNFFNECSVRGHISLLSLR